MYVKKIYAATKQMGSHTPTHEGHEWNGGTNMIAHNAEHSQAADSTSAAESTSHRDLISAGPHRAAGVTMVSFTAL